MKGKGKGIFFHPTLAPTSERCLERDPTRGPTPKPPFQRSKPGRPSGQAVASQSSSYIGNVASSKRIPFTGPNFNTVYVQYLARLTTQPSLQPALPPQSKQQQQLVVPMNPTPISAQPQASSPTPKIQPTRTPNKWNADPVDFGSSGNSHNDDENDSFGLNSIQIVLIGILGVGAIFLVGGVIACLIYKEHRNERLRKHRRFEGIAQETKQEHWTSLKFEQNYSIDPELQHKETQKENYEQAQGTNQNSRRQFHCQAAKRTALETKPTSPEQQTDTAKNVQSYLMDPWNDETGYEREDNYDGLFRRRNNGGLLDAFPDELILAGSASTTAIDQN